MNPVINRRSCIQGLIGAGALVGMATPSLARSTGQATDIAMAWHVEGLEAQTMASALAPGARLQAMPAHLQNDMAWWQQLAAQLHGQSHRGGA